VSRAFAGVALAVSGVFGWLFGSQGEAPPQTWRDDSLAEWHGERDAEREAERQARGRQNRDS
jgi:hypothetical protein